MIPMLTALKNLFIQIQMYTGKDGLVDTIGTLLNDYTD